MIHFDKDTIGQYTIGRVVMKTQLATVTPGMKNPDIIGHIVGLGISLHGEVTIEVQWAGHYEMGKLEMIPGNRYSIHPKNIILL